MSATGAELDLAFLFTDIVGSTRLWEDHGAAMPAALAHHNALLETAVAASQGRVFKTMGDGVYAVFAKPGDALDAAIAAQHALCHTDWSALGLTRDLTVRMAVHAGPVQEIDGDFSGAPLNRIARLLDAGHGAQILLFANCPGLATRIAEGFSLRDLGERRLPDIPGTERILQVIAPGLPHAFPPLRTLDPIPHNLPTPPTALIDRAPELERLHTWLSDPATRLITLTGPGGIGKTRLALQTAFDLLDSYADGVWLADLSAVREDDQVVHATLLALGIADSFGERAQDVLLGWLRTRRILLVLDNCEQVVAASARLAAAIVSGAPGVQILATGRQSLGLRGEHRLQVEPLPVPEARASADLRSIAAAPAVQLFVARGAEARHSFALTEGNASTVADICRQVDGIPLALELAAARVVTLSPAALRERLNTRLPVLSTGSRDHPSRQQTLLAAIAWSYELLDPPVRDTFARLAVFAGGWTLSGAQLLLGPMQTTVLEDDLTTLVDHSLVRVDPDAPDEARFSMLETIREFAAERLRELEQEAELREAHAAYFLALSAAASPHLLGGPEQLAWMQRIDREHQNLRSAALWWLDQRDSTRVLELCSNIWHYWSIRGGARDGSELIRRALANGDDIAAPLRAGSLRKFGNLSIAIGDTRMARSLYEESLSIERQEENRTGIADCLIDLGMVAVMQGRLDGFSALLEESAEIHHELGDTRGEATAMFNAAIGWRDAGELDRAERLFEQVLAIQEALPDRIGIAWSWLSLGRVARDRGNIELARHHAEAAAAIFLEAGDDEAIASTNELIAGVEHARGNLDGARMLLKSALATHDRRSDIQKAAETLEALALVEFNAGLWEQSSLALLRATSLREQSGCPVPPIDAPALQQLSIQLARLRDRDPAETLSKNY